MHKLFRRHTAAVACVVLSVTAVTTHAQATPPPPAPSDYVVYGAIDTVAPAALTTSTPVFVGGWDLECRSGLQPGVQRLGTVFVSWQRIYNWPYAEMQPATVISRTIVARSDVAAAYRGTCPAMGDQVGFNMTITPPPDAGTWTLVIEVEAIDSAGRSALRRLSKPSIVVNY